jgi:hypothetical protein
LVRTLIWRSGDSNTLGFGFFQVGIKRLDQIFPLLRSHGLRGIFLKNLFVPKVIKYRASAHEQREQDEHEQPHIAFSLGQERGKIGRSDRRVKLVGQESSRDGRFVTFPADERLSLCMAPVTCNAQRSPRGILSQATCSGLVLVAAWGLTWQAEAFDQPVTVADVHTHRGYYERNSVTMEAVVNDVRYQTRYITDWDNGIDFPITVYVFDVTDDSGTMTVEARKAPETGLMKIRAEIVQGAVVVYEMQRVRPLRVRASC